GGGGEALAGGNGIGRHIMSLGGELIGTRRTQPMMTTILLAVHLAAAEPAPQLLVEVDDPKLTKEFHLLDVRGKAKYEDGHIPGAVLAEIGPWSKTLTAGEGGGAVLKAELGRGGGRPQQPGGGGFGDPPPAAPPGVRMKTP